MKQIILMATTMAVVPAVGAAERVNVERIIACANEPDDARRLACYDSAIAKVKAPVSETQSAPAPTAAKPAVPEPVAPPAIVTTEHDFGVNGSAVARQRRSEQEQEKSEAVPRTLAAEVTEVTKQPLGQLVITLNNGQVWMQKDAERYFPIKPGDQVTINAGTLGSFHLINGKRSTRVTRVK